MSYKFISNKYSKYYTMLCERARGRLVEGYTEKHHIIPRSLGGRDTPDNLVSLTAREHFVAHLLLTKITEGMDKSRMFLAVRRMCHSSKYNPRDFKVTSHTFEHIKHNAIQYFVGLPSKKKGVPLAETVKEKIRAKRALQVFTPEMNAKRALGVSGSVWVNNGSINKRVKQHNLQHFLNQGFVVGRTNVHVTPEFKAKMQASVTASWVKRKGEVV